MSTELQVQPVTPMSLIERAASSNASIEQMQQLLDLQIRWEADQARKAFHAAMAKFKANPPVIVRNVKKQAGQISLFYASLDNCVAKITPALSAVGLRHRWEMMQTEAGWVIVACIISHELGHHETTELKAQVDSSGSKNPIQAIASTVTYLERYTLLAATGLAATDTDDDGAGTGKAPKMHEAELAQALGFIAAADTKEQAVAIFQAAYKEAQEIGDQIAMADLLAAKNKRKAEL